MGLLRELRLGASYLGSGNCRFCVWAPLARQIEVRLLGPPERCIPLTPSADGYFETTVEAVEPGSLYYHRLDGQKERPDPASRSQPQGVHGPSQVIDAHFAWQDAGWFGLPLRDYVLYELHVGAFTPQGTFAAIIPRLDELKDLGITAIEVMPVAQFPGTRNWGYDGAYPFAVQNSYGGPAGLKQLVNACHQRGLALVLDVVYNHLGPEGNYLAEYGPYFTDRYRTPWGQALNFDGPDSDHVRRYFLENALYWISEFHVDALRLDAVHAIRDFSARPFLEELAGETAEWAERLNRRCYLIAESDLNDARLIRPPELGGCGLAAQWSDDFHHCLHTLLTGERRGYYQDYEGVAALAKALREGFVYSGEYSRLRLRRHGNSSRDVPPWRMVICTQNHDQVGNRMLGERLSHMLSPDEVKLAAAAMILSPYLPLLFMGEEYGEPAPFQYFTSHDDPNLARAVCEGRRAEFAEFRWQGQAPDPQDEATFGRSQLQWDLRRQGTHAALGDFYKELLRLRRTVPALALLSKDHMEVTAYPGDQAILVRRWAEADEVCLVMHFGEAARALPLPFPAGTWDKLLDPANARWQGSGSQLPDRLSSVGTVSLALGPRTFVLYQRSAQPNHE